MTEGKVIYFYTEDYPHRWGQGPREILWNPETGTPIENLEEAKMLAEKKATHGIYNENRCVTTYGVKTEYHVEDKDD